MFDANDLGQVLDRLEGVEDHSGYSKALCPAHEDTNPSLSITKKGSKVLLHCHAGCEHVDVISALEGRENGWRSHHAPTNRTRRTVEATYDYGGFEVVRYAGKQFRQRRKVNGRWVYNLDGITPCLYHEDEVLQAAANGETVYVVEGEKDVERLREDGRVATCNPMGAGKWRVEYSDALRGADVIVVADRDTPGAKHAQQVKRSLIGVARSVRVVEALTGKDSSDHLDAGHTIEEFREVTVAPSRSGVTDGATFILDTPDKIPTIWGKNGEVLWAEGESLLMVGPQGVGKSTLLQQLALARIGIRSSVLGLPVTADDRQVLYIAADRPSQIRRSLARMVSEDDRKLLSSRLVIHQGPLPFNLSTQPEAFAGWIEELGVGSVFVDSLKDVALDLSKDETGSRVNAAFQEVLARGVEVVATHHQRKAQANNKRPTTISDVYGSTWITAGAGSVVLLWGAPGDLVIEMTHLKQPLEEVGPLRLMHDHATGETSVVVEFDVTVTLRDRGTTVRAFASKLFSTDAPNANEIEKARRKLDALVKAGEAEAIERPRSGGGKPEKVYRLKEGS